MSVAPPRLIAHLDMDAFYASVELLRYPELRGRAVVIGGGRRHQPEEIVDPHTGRVERRFATLRGYAGRGVITTATYEARAFGLHSALGLMKAAQLAPDTILLPVDFDAYRRYSRLFKAAVGAIAPEIEDRGIDEIFVDLTGIVLPGASERGRRVAARTRYGAGAQEGGAQRDRTIVLDRDRAEQAAGQDRLRARQARRLDLAADDRASPRASGRCRRAGSTASARSPALDCKRWAYVR